MDFVNFIKPNISQMGHIIFSSHDTFPQFPYVLSISMKATSKKPKFDGSISSDLYLLKLFSTA